MVAKPPTLTQRVQAIEGRHERLDAYSRISGAMQSSSPPPPPLPNGLIDLDTETIRVSRTWPRWYVSAVRCRGGGISAFTLRGLRKKVVRERMKRLLVIEACRKV